MVLHLFPGQGFLLLALRLLLTLPGGLQLPQPLLLLLVILDPFFSLLLFHLLKHGVVPWKDNPESQ